MLVVPFFLVAQANKCANDFCLGGEVYHNWPMTTRVVTFTSICYTINDCCFVNKLFSENVCRRKF